MLSVIFKFVHAKGGLISEGILTLVPLPKKVPNYTLEQILNGKLFTEKSRKFEFSAQGRGFPTFVGNGTKVKILSEIKPPLKGS